MRCFERCFFQFLTMRFFNDVSKNCKTSCKRCPSPTPTSKSCPWGYLAPQRSNLVRILGSSSIPLVTFLRHPLIAIVDCYSRDLMTWFRPAELILTGLLEPAKVLLFLQTRLHFTSFHFVFWSCYLLLDKNMGYEKLESKHFTYSSDPPTHPAFFSSAWQ